MSEFNESTELAAELTMESVKEDEKSENAPRWHKWVSATTLLMALLSAVGAMFAGITAHEILLDRTEEIVALTTSQGDRLAIQVLKNKHEILISRGEVPDETELAQIVVFEAEVEELEREAERDEAGVQSSGRLHLIFAISATILAIGISLSGMAIIIGQRLLWYSGMIFGAVGAIGVGLGIAIFVVT